MTIGKRIFGGMACAITLTIAMGLFGVTRLAAIERQTLNMSAVSLPGIQRCMELGFSNRDNISLSLQRLNEKDPRAKQELDALLNKGSEKSSAVLAGYEKTINQEQERQIFQKLQNARAAYRQASQEALKLDDANKNEEALALFSRDVRPKFAAYNAALDELIEFNRNACTQNAQTINETLAGARFGLYVALGISVAVGACLIILITRSITKPVLRISSTLGDGSAQVASASGQVSSSSQSLAQGASEQAAALEETTSALEEMSSMTKKNADSALQAAALSSEAQKSAAQGNQAMAKMSNAINDIEKSASETAKIIKVIDEIAFQTNLLALNAAVEAARAGEAGKGFAVVAEEVRSLAMRSAEAARNTASMIEESVNNARNGVTIAAEVAHSLQDITTATTKVNALVAEIAAASREQSQGIGQVNTAVAEMDKVTQSNAASAEESASAAEELSSQALQLNELVTQLGALVGSANKSRNTQSRLAGPASNARATQSLAMVSHGSAVKQSPAHAIPLDASEVAKAETFAEFNTTA